ncbi:MAG: hypothetical protein ABSH37_09015 [Bryobacteraceae bacterium]|jgi:hypothetical protein
MPGLRDGEARSTSTSAGVLTPEGIADDLQLTGAVGHYSSVHPGDRFSSPLSGRSKPLKPLSKAQKRALERHERNRELFEFSRRIIEANPERFMSGTEAVCGETRRAIMLEAARYGLTEDEVLDVLTADDGMSHVISAFGSFGRDIRYASQERTEAAGQPDITGRDENGNVVLVVEVKFWAGLTDNQPAQYLQIVKPAGLLLVVSPEVRLQELWCQLILRARNCGVTTEAGHGFEKFAATVDGRTMALISWRRLLDALAESAKEAGDRIAGSDLQQLSALCEQMDTEAFVPLRQEEICDVGHAKRSLQYCELVDAIAEVAKHKGCRIFRPSAGFGYYGVDLRFGELRAYLAFSPRYWLTWGISPLWSQVRNAGTHRRRARASIPRPVGAGTRRSGDDSIPTCS